VSAGVLVEDVRNSRVDLRPGDVLLSLIDRGAQTDIKSVEQFNSLLPKIERGSSITLLIRRGDSQTFVTLKAGSDK
jgi:serine protease Do